MAGAFAWLAWLLAMAPHIVPIPGTTRSEHLRENVAAATLALEFDLIERADSLINERDVTGARYGAQSQSEVDTEEF